MSMQRTDEEMVAVREGRLDELEPLFGRYRDSLFEFFSRLTDSRVASEDLVQEVFVRILKYRGTYRESNRFVTWMYQIATQRARRLSTKILYSVGMRILNTGRLFLRIWEPSDFPLAKSLWADPDVMTFLGGPLNDEKILDKMHAEIACAEKHGVQYWPLFCTQAGLLGFDEVRFKACAVWSRIIFALGSALVRNRLNAQVPVSGETRYLSRM